MHVYPTRGYSSLFKPGSDVFKILESARHNIITSSLYELDTEDFLIEDRGKLFLPEYLDRTLTPNEKRAMREKSSRLYQPTQPGQTSPSIKIHQQ